MKNRTAFLATLLFIYVILFEFVLPVNKILPKPSLLLESIPALFNDYNLLTEMAVSTTVIYLSIPFAYLLIYFISYFMDKLVSVNEGMFNNFRIFKNFPAFFFAVLFAFWFGGSLWAELLFAVFASTLFLTVTYIEESKNVEKKYLNSAENLMIMGKELHRKVIWKYVQPKIFSELKRLHYYLWVLLLIYEFIAGVAGFGSVYKIALEYRDFSAIVSLGILIAILISIGNSVIEYVKKKIVFWKV